MGEKREESEFTLLAEIIMEMQQGDMSHFQDFYDHTKKMVYFQLKAAGVENSSIEDVMQEVYIRFFKGIDSIQNPLASYKWLKQTAYRIGINHVKSSIVKHEELFTEDDDAKFETEGNLSAPLPMPEDIMENKVSQQLIRDILESLPQLQYKMIVAYYYNESSVKEIAEMLEVPDGTVKTNLFRARKYIKERVEELEKKHNTKLYSVSFAPIFAMLCQEQIEALTVSISASAIAGKIGIVSSTAETAATASTAATVGKAATATILKKIIIGVVLTLVVGAGGVATYMWINSRNHDAIEDRVAEKEENAQEKEDEEDSSEIDKEIQTFYEYVENELVPKLGVASLNQSGKVIIKTDEESESPVASEEWLDINGLTMVDIFDYDQDGQKEMLVVYGENASTHGHYYFSNDFKSMKYKAEMYEMINDEVTMVSSQDLYLDKSNFTGQQEMFAPNSLGQYDRIETHFSQMVISRMKEAGGYVIVLSQSYVNSAANDASQGVMALKYENEQLTPVVAVDCCPDGAVDSSIWVYDQCMYENGSFKASESWDNEDNTSQFLASLGLDITIKYQADKDDWYSLNGEDVTELFRSNVTCDSIEDEGKIFNMSYGATDHTNSRDYLGVETAKATSTEADQQNAGGYKEAYKAILADPKGWLEQQTTVTSDYQSFSYALYDLNGDDIPELWLQSQNNQGFVDWIFVGYKDEEGAYLIVLGEGYGANGRSGICICEGEVCEFWFLTGQDEIHISKCWLTEDDFETGEEIYEGPWMGDNPNAPEMEGRIYESTDLTPLNN